MDGISSATPFCNLLCTIGQTLRIAWTFHVGTWAFGNFSLNSFSRPGSQTITLRTMPSPSKLLPFRSLKQSRQGGADSSSPGWNTSTRFCSVSVTPIATTTGASFMPASICISKLKPSTDGFEKVPQSFK
jgi:hypothetical protein